MGALQNAPPAASVRNVAAGLRCDRRRDVRSAAEHRFQRGNRRWRESHPAAVPYAQTLAISPGGATLYACISSGPTGELAAYSAATGKLSRVLYHWTLAPASDYFCQVSADVTGKVLLASYSSILPPRTGLIGMDLHAGTTVKLPIRVDYTYDGVGAAW